MRIQRMAKEFNKAMNSINPDLVFTIEIAEDFENGKLATLDTELDIDNSGVISLSDQ